MVAAPHVPSPDRPVPTATYRLQLHSGFTFADAARLVPYFRSLGVSHLFLSPYLQAIRGSTHGYDIVDHSRVNDELGGAEGFAALVAACRVAGLGLVLDVVPNHMYVGPPQDVNAAWWDVLLHGRESAYAEWFDIEWSAPDNPGRVLVPVLGGPLADEIQNVRLDTDDGTTVVRYHEHVLPVAPGTETTDLVAVLDAQRYRLCHWRVAADELNYRRFFDITSMAAVRVEDPKVFSETHETVLRHVADCAIDGLRIDHPDGLTDPQLYLEHLQRAAGDVWVVVEKILEPGESLPPEWGCAGTTGYDALNVLTGLLVDPAGENALTTLYSELTQQPTTYGDVVAAAKREVLRASLAAEVNRLVHVVAEIRAHDLRGRDFTRQALSEALVEFIACFDVYRAYVRPGKEPSLPAAARLAHAAKAATLNRPDRAAEIAYIHSLALGAGIDQATGQDRRRRAEFVTRLQQTCGPAMAKGVEDTAFYRYQRFVALNEVGGDPGRFGVSVDEFHAHNALMQRDWPLTMTTLSTHDTKRSEDVRARLALLSEIPRQWGEAVVEWSARNERHRSPPFPDRNTEYLLYQTLVGAWPLDVDRALEYARKAVREAKQHTSWTAPNLHYEDAVHDFVRRLFTDEEFQAMLRSFIEPLIEPGRVNSLVQKLLQLTMPGVPDIYQGNETWDFSLVDPDNRRPVDYTLRQSLLETGSDPKLLVTSTVLRLRREHPECFGADATYEPVLASGAAAGHVVAFLRGAAVLTVVPRLVLQLRGRWKDTSLTLPSGLWRNALAGEVHDGGEQPVGELLASFPVALLVRG